MKRRFAIPAAIALTAHALLFLGLGKPPTPPKDLVIVTKLNDIKKPDDVDIMKLIEIVRVTESDPRDVSEKKGGGDPDDAPPSMPDFPPVKGPTEPLFTQDPVPYINGHGKTVPTLGFRRLGDGPGLGDAAVSAGLLDNPPRTRFQKAPIYPFAMKTTGTSGTVWVDFMVDETGRVHDVRVLKSTNPEFEDATRDAVSLWRFEPGKRKGIPVRFRMSLPVVFNLAD